MNTKLNKVMPVLLAVVAVLAISTFQVFAYNPSENDGFSHRSSASQSTLLDDHGNDAVDLEVGEDMTLSGTVEAISAGSITIDGKVIALDASTRLDSGVMVGSMVKIEVIQQADGTLLAKEVESENETEVEHLNGDDIDADELEVGEDMTLSGTVEAISAGRITIDGKVIPLDASTRLDSGVMAGSMVKIEVIQQADGTLLAKEVESENETEVEHLNGDNHGNGTEMGDDHGNGTEMGDNHGTDTGKIDDKGTGSGSDDDHGGNSGSGSSRGGDDHGGNSGKGK